MPWDFYKDLPDSMTQENVLRYFDELLILAHSQECVRPELAQILLELADRHWHTYKVMPPFYKDRIEGWIEANWDSASLNKDFIEVIASIAGHLGLTNTLKLLENTLNRNVLRCDLQAVLRNEIEELRPHISDPYSGVRH